MFFLQGFYFNFYLLFSDLIYSWIILFAKTRTVELPKPTPSKSGHISVSTSLSSTSELKSSHLFN